MSESKRVKVSSVAAFMFLPQFHLCFRGFAHIVPVFIRTVALVFVASGLIPNNHPATRYGVEGVKKYSFTELVGEAWFTLRTTNASVQQWGLFIAIMMMMTALVTALVSFVLRLFFNLGAVAQAQIFDHPAGTLGVASPYGAGNATDLTTVQTTTAGATGFFDMRTATNASQDWGLMVLDKVVRQSAVGEGGAFQQALASLMQVYNTGVMVVAAIMLFWMILSIVVDTAKSGIVGGGRHNMVWTPIRVVFALGIMIPLGTNGFSSGQYMVMKLAEWGSNFATRGWATYVDAVVTNTSILTAYNPKNASDRVAGITKVMTCMVAYNASVLETTGQTHTTFGAGHTIGLKSTYDNASGVTSNKYTNRTRDALCGTISFTGLGKAIPANAVNNEVTADLVAAGVNMANIGQAIVDYRNAMATAVAALVDDADGIPGAASGGAVINKTRQLACAIVRQYFSDGGTPANHPVTGTPGTAPCPVINPDACSPTPGGPPDSTCAEEAVMLLSGALSAAEGGARTNLVNWITTNLKPQMVSRGWAGMGGWFIQINALNQMIQSAQTDSVSVTPGVLWSNQRTGIWNDCMPGTYKWGVDSCTIPEVHRKVYTSMGQYDKWWTNMTTNAPRKLRAQAADQLTPSEPLDENSIWDLAMKWSKDGSSAMNDIVKMIFPTSQDGVLIIDVLDPSDTTSYPLAQLVRVGSTIRNYGFAIMVVNSLIGILAGAITDYAASTIAVLIGTVAKALILAGIIIGIYLPILPLIRVSFAVLTWIISVFEAVVMVPIAALAHLSSEGEGLAGGARTAWILWLNVLLRPILVVMGFVGAMLVFNSFTLYFHQAFIAGVDLGRAQMDATNAIISLFTYSVVYVAVMYTVANTTFKMLDTIPDAMMRWIGGSPDKSFDDNSDGMMYAASNMLTNARGNPMKLKPGLFKKKSSGIT